MSIHDPVLTVYPTTEVCVLPHMSEVVGRGNAARQAGLELPNSADLPATEHLSGEASFLTEEGSRIEIVENQNVTGIEF